MHDWESIYDALKGAVGALGGFKKVGPMLRPDFHDAANWLRNCLNPEHAQKLDPEQMTFLVRKACEAGYHDTKHWIDGDTGYQHSAPLALQAQLAEELAHIQARRRRDDEDERALRSLIDNPKLMALANAMHLKVEGL